MILIVTSTEKWWVIMCPQGASKRLYRIKQLRLTRPRIKWMRAAALWTLATIRPLFSQKPLQRHFQRHWSFQCKIWHIIPRMRHHQRVSNKLNYKVPLNPLCSRLTIPTTSAVQFCNWDKLFKPKAIGRRVGLNRLRSPTVSEILSKRCSWEMPQFSRTSSLGTRGMSTRGWRVRLRGIRSWSRLRTSGTWHCFIRSWRLRPS